MGTYSDMMVEKPVIFLGDSELLSSKGNLSVSSTVPLEGITDPSPFRQPKGFVITGEAVVEGRADTLERLFMDKDDVQVCMVPNDLCLPRKMKKAFRASHGRDTKWKHRALAWRNANQKTFTGRISSDHDGITFTARKQ